MFRLLSIELHKLKYNKASKVLTIIYFVLLSLLVLASFMKINLFVIELKLSEQGIFEFPYIWHFNTYVASLFKFFLLLIIVSMVSNEYANKTLKQNLIDGLSKREYILSKFYTVILYALTSAIFISIVSLILGLTYSTKTSFEYLITDSTYLIGYFIKLLTYLSFGLFAGILIKRSAFAIGALLIWYIIESIIVAYLRHIISGDSIEYIVALFPFTAMEGLITEPITSMETFKEMGGIIGSTHGVPMFNVGACLAWTIIFVLLSFVIIKKRDL